MTDTLNESDYSDSIKESLLEILKDCELEDEYIRHRMLRECKQNELYWHGFQQIFWDERVQDFRIPTHDVMEQISSREETKSIYDYVVNIFKAHGLSIIAALSAEVPGVPFAPYDAEDTGDIIAARKAESLGKLIQKFNKSKLLFYHALFTLFTNHFVTAYNYYERDKKHGISEIPKFKTQKVKAPDAYNCDCGYSGEEELLNCPSCHGELNKVEGLETDQVIDDGVEEVERGMERIIIKGTLNIKLPSWAADQEACGYLIDYSDQHYAWIRNNYTNIPFEKLSKGDVTDNFERIARMPSIGRLYSDTYLQSLLTLKRVWLRPWMFDSLDKDRASELHKAFPEGVYFAVVGNDVFAEAREECLDDHWTIAKGDLSRNIHGDPLCKPLLPLQDLENMVTNLLVESLEHSVPATFADPEILDFDLYSKQEVAPGSIYPAKSPNNPNKNIDSYFYTLKTSTLPKEGVDFGQIVDSKSQFVVGAFPSIFGGPQTEGSKTLGEYQESRSYALQRLSIPYQLLFFWWADTIHKSVIDYIGNMLEDEKHTVNGANGRYNSINLIVSEFKSGKFQTLLPDAAVDLPVSYSQKRSTIQSVLQLNSDTINQFLFSPENRRTTLGFLGLEELADLDSNQSMKQLMEIDELINSAPIVGLDGMEVSSVPTEEQVDDDEIHLRILRTFLAGPYGQELKKDNPEGYKNALLHGKEHYDRLQMKLMAEAQAGARPNKQPAQETEQ